ncbi:Methyl-accepting chemotaxis protein CtpH [Planctomycetes bacterium Pan216]|uniref:Methyl-accepting chemotaxis protein CtpH n=1 Tax=Kolteria novifilia TaxID=2527975 RepID=A0A518B4I0_9BACT|nr:Methyl-accepting chemotaxis protein CtpH [Planctomycetes bacterium Pan216]
MVAISSKQRLLILVALAVLVPSALALMALLWEAGQVRQTIAQHWGANAKAEVEGVATGVSLVCKSASQAGVSRGGSGILRTAITRPVVGRQTAYMIIPNDDSKGAAARVDPVQLLAERGFLPQGTKGKEILNRLSSTAIDARGSTTPPISFAVSPSDQGTSSAMVASAVYFAPWDWIIVAFAEQHEAGSPPIAMSSQYLIGGMFVASFILLVLGLVAARGLAWSFSAPLRQLADIQQSVGDGDLVAARGHVLARRPSENGSPADRGRPWDHDAAEAIRAADKMTRAILLLLQGLRRAIGEMSTTSENIVSTSNQQERTIMDFGASTSQIATAVKEISATSQELVGTMEDVASVSANATELAESGRTSLEGMEATMKQLADATSSIRGKLSVIREKAGDINLVVTTINKVADQTNLLSVNAAIEAEKAGEFGTGFAVVAQEIRRLADQSATSMFEIEHMVDEMHAAVTAGVQEMDRFADEVRGGVAEVGTIGSHLIEIIESVRAMTPRFDSVNEGMRAQSLGARQISEAMIKLTDGARAAAESVEHLNGATQSLRGGVEELRHEVDRFRVE